MIKNEENEERNFILRGTKLWCTKLRTKSTWPLLPRPKITDYSVKSYFDPKKPKLSFQLHIHSLCANVCFNQKKEKIVEISHSNFILVPNEK